MPRLTTPSARPASTIRGKIVTISNFIPGPAKAGPYDSVRPGLLFGRGGRLQLARPRFVQLQKALGRVDPDPARHNIDLGADPLDHRDLNLASCTLHDQSAAAGATLDTHDSPDR